MNGFQAQDIVHLTFWWCAGGSWLPVGTALNPSGSVYHINGSAGFASACGLINTLADGSVGTIYDDVSDDFTCDPFNVASHIFTGNIILANQSATYKTEKTIHEGIGDSIGGQPGTRGISSGVTVTGPLLRPGASFPAQVVDPAAAFGLGTSAGQISDTTTGCTTGLTAGNYLALYTYLTAAGDETLTSPTMASALAITGGHCILVTSPGAHTGATQYNVFVTPTAGGAEGTEAFQVTEPLGTNATLGSSGSLSNTVGPPNANTTAALIVIGNTPGETQGDVFHATVHDMYVDCDGVAGSIGVANVGGQELSGVFNVDFHNCGGRATVYWEGYHYSSQGAENSGMSGVNISDSTCSVSHPCGGGSGGSVTTPVNSTYGIQLSGVKTSRFVRDFTITMKSGTANVAGVEVTGETPVGVQNDIGATVIEFGHCEGASGTFLYCVEAKNLAGQTQSNPLVVRNVNASTGLTTAAVHLDSNATNSVLAGIIMGSAKPTLQDDVNNCTSPGGTSISFYALGAAGQRITNLPFGSTCGGALGSGATQRLTADTAVTATSPGTVVFTWGALPPSANFSFHCGILYSQATGTAVDGMAVQGATNAPTRLDAWGKMDVGNPTSAGYSGSANSALNITTTTATTVVTATPGAVGAVYQATLDGTIQVGASASTLNVLLFTGNASDAVTVKAGSYCSIMP